MECLIGESPKPKTSLALAVLTNQADVARFSSITNERFAHR